MVEGGGVAFVDTDEGKTITAHKMFRAVLLIVGYELPYNVQFLPQTPTVWSVGNEI